MRAVGPDHQAGADRAAIRQRRHDIVVVLFQRRNALPETVFHVPGGGLVEDIDEIAAQDLEFTDHAVAVECADRHLRAPPPLGGHPRNSPLIQTAFPHPVHQAHPLDHGPPGTAQVDGLAAQTKIRCDLDNDDPISIPGEPVGQGGSTDPGSADQDCRLRHARNTMTYMSNYTGLSAAY